MPLTAPESPEAPQSLKARYERLKLLREPFLRRARSAVKLTIPSLLRADDGHNSDYTFECPWQSVGARGSNNLASKLLLVLFPPNRPFFRLVLDAVARQKIKSEHGEEAAEMLARFEQAFAAIERIAVQEYEAAAARPVVHEALLHLINTGNGLLREQEDGRLRFYPLDTYVAHRDPSGKVLEVITRTCVDRSTLAPDVRALLPVSDEPPGPGNNTVEVFTGTRLVDGERWETHQEVGTVRIPGSESSLPASGPLPWMLLRWKAVPEESYGRSLVEEYYGDLRTLDNLEEGVASGALISSRVYFLKRPGSPITRQEIAKARNGAIFEGSEGDITAVQVDKFADFRAATERAAVIERRLEQAFLLTSSVQREAERVTAEEIRALAGEIEDTLGGVYTVLAQELQLPVARLLFRRLERKRGIPTLPAGMVKTVVLGGYDALGRGSDLRNLRVALGTLAETLGPEIIGSRLRVDAVIKRVMDAQGIDTAGLLRSEEELQAEAEAQAQQAQQAELVSKLGPPAIKAATDIAALQQQQGAAQQQPQGT